MKKYVTIDGVKLDVSNKRDSSLNVAIMNNYLDRFSKKPTTLSESVFTYIFGHLFLFHFFLGRK